MAASHHGGSGASSDEEDDESPPPCESPIPPSALGIWQRIESQDGLRATIFKQIDKAKDLARTGAVCRAWRQSASEDTLWKDVCSRSSNPLLVPVLKSRPSIGCTPSWKQIYAQGKLDLRKYWELLDIMRPYKNFTVKYVNGPVRRWKEKSENELLTELDPVKRTRLETHVKISVVIGKMFRRLQRLCEDDPKDFKVPPNLQHLLKINETLIIVVKRCSQARARDHQQLLSS